VLRKPLPFSGNKILAVGSEDTVLETAGADATIIDLEGKTVLPGFIDAHTHVVSGSVVDSIMDYVGMARFSTAAEVLEHISSRVAETPAGEWLAFRNFDPAVQDGPDALTFKELDAASKNTRSLS
jgi:predicted amidohydrolase YtcJ